MSARSTSSSSRDTCGPMSRRPSDLTRLGSGRGLKTEKEQADNSSSCIVQINCNAQRDVQAATHALAAAEAAR
eukprot:16615-Heterococcus_DN1.PRE.6